MVMEDCDIIQLYFDRDEQAIAETSAKYGNYCRSIALNILNNPQDAEECVNETYLKAWNAIPPNRPVLFKTFLGRITRNLSFNQYRKMNAEKRGNGQMNVILDELEECLSDGNDSSKEFSRTELVEAINEFLKKLPQTQRIMFVRRYWYADPVSQIAKRCGVSENAVSVALNRLRRKLHNELLERGFEL